VLPGARGGATCKYTRDECRTEANSSRTTCVLADAPVCYDLTNVEVKSTDPQCFFDWDACEGARHSVIRAEYAKGPCYRADRGLALKISNCRALGQGCDDALRAMQGR
jgi:hypothetical protein